MSKKPAFHPDFKTLADTANITSIQLTEKQTQRVHSIDNLPGKQASVKIYATIINNHTIGTAEAQRGLDLYGDYVEDEKQNPNSHPNIRLLLDVIEQQQTWQVEILE